MNPSYPLERDLVDDLVAHLPDALHQAECRLLAREVTAGNRVVDVVLAESQAPLDALADPPRLCSALNGLNKSQLEILALIWRSRSTSLARICKETWTPEGHVLEDWIRPLLNRGMIEQSGQRTYAAPMLAAWRPTLVIGIEAKLRDWKGALAQAVDNRSRCDWSFAAFPADERLPMDMIRSRAAESGVGIMVVGGAPGCRILLRPRLSPASKHATRWLLGLDMLIGGLEAGNFESPLLHL